MDKNQKKLREDLEGCFCKDLNEGDEDEMS